MEGQRALDWESGLQVPVLVLPGSAVQLWGVTVPPWASFFLYRKDPHSLPLSPPPFPPPLAASVPAALAQVLTLHCRQGPGGEGACVR